MRLDPAYPQLNQLFGAYLNEDCAYWGTTIAEIVGCYIRDSSRKDIEEMLVEIDQFQKNNARRSGSRFR